MFMVQYETLSPHEWKTFILRWNETMKSISVYDSEKLLMTYEDNEGRPRNHSPRYNLFLRSSKTMLFRFHTCELFPRILIAVG